MTSRHGRMRGLPLAVIGLVLVGALAYLAVRAFSGERLDKVSGLPLVHVQSHDPRPWLVLALVAAVLALAGWALTERDRLRLARSAGERESTERQANERATEAEARAEEARARAEKTEQRAREVERERRTEHEQNQRFARAWQAQREWNRELRDQVAALQHRNGILGRLDTHEMILRLTVELTEAEKGILLSRPDDDDGGALEVIAATGFEHDPRESAVAQHFAETVIERDQTIRVDHQAELEAEKRTPADEEVHNLLAIPIYLRDDFHGVIVCANHDGGFDHLDDEVLLAVGNHAGAVMENSRLHGQLRGAYLQTVRTLSSVIEVKDPDLRGHSDAVAEYVMAVADHLGFEPRRREELLFGALLHDVGKIGISERILLKPARLTEEEFSVMQLHPRIGYHLIRQIPALEPIALAVLHHHERYDGTGYPGRLSGELIPLEARVIAVADAFSAMIMTRPYKSALSVEEACRELERCAGGQFDPQVVTHFVSEVRRRPPEELARDPAPPDPELEVHRQPGSFVLGGSSFGLIDSLTLLYSHRYFHERARAEAQRAALGQQPFSVIVARLFELPKINREQGFAAGDAALQTVAESFQRIAARLGGVACRVSGCRIGLVAPGIEQSAAEALAERLHDELEERITCGLGVAAWQTGESAEQMIERATRAARPTEDSLPA